MAFSKSAKKVFKVSAIITGVLLVLLVALHFWFKAHAKELVEDMVETRSHGKLKLKMGKFRFTYFSKKMEIDNAVFYNTDTIKGTTSYRFSVAKMKIRVNSIWSVLFQKQILIDSLSLLNPDITVTHLRDLDKKADDTKEDISIPEEMGKVYNSIQDALEVLKVSRFQIDNARFTLLNKADPQQLPLKISNIHFRIDNLVVDSNKSTGKQKILFSDNIVLTAGNQNIIFPDGRHRLSFHQFRINIKKRLVEFDSCTIAATKADSSTSSFNVFFDVLVMTNIDFDTLYRHEVIKADSVYCVNPRFKLNVELAGNKNDIKPPPKLDKIIQQLTGDIALGFVIVNNCSFDITTIRNGRPNSFTSDHNNFEMQGFRVNKDAPKPIQIKSFAMAIRNYENFLRDSTYAMNFDSIILNTDRVVLSNFSFRHFVNGKVINSFNIPHFELAGLSGDALLFDQKLKAQSAYLYNPLINYTASPNKTEEQRKQNIFQSLAGINNIIQLENFNIINGEINVHLNGGILLHLYNASMSVSSRPLLRSKKIMEIQQSVSHLNFEKGSVHINNITAELENVFFNGHDQQLTAGNIRLLTEQKNITASASNVALDKVIINDSTKKIELSGVKWEDADFNIALPSLPDKKKTTAYSILLKNINAANTKLEIKQGEKIISGFLQSTIADEYNMVPGSTPSVTNLATIGKNLKFADKKTVAAVDNFQVTDNSNSVFKKISYHSNDGKDTVAITAPLLSLVPDINAILHGTLKLNDVTLTEPAFSLHVSHPDSTLFINNNKFPEFIINSLTIKQPVVSYIQPGITGTVAIEWNGMAEKNDVLKLEDISIRKAAKNIVVQKMGFSLNHFLFINAEGKKFKAGNGSIEALIRDIHLQKNTDEPWNWSSTVSDLYAKNFVIDSLGKTDGRLAIEHIALKELTVTSANITSIRKLVTTNSTMRLHQFNGNYSNNNNYLQWYNANFNHGNREFSVDSFLYHPLLMQDSFMAKQHFQTDYVRLHTGAIHISGIDLNRYIKDSIMDMHVISVNDVLMSDYRDKRLPFKTGVIKALPVNLVKKIPGRVSIDTIELNNGNVIYTEINAKTNEPAPIPVTRITAKVFPVKNYNLADADSLTIQASGYILDTAWIRLRVSESLKDTAAGFLMTLKIKPADLQILNPVLIPMSSVKIQAGYLDTLSLRAAGEEYFAFGKVIMQYHDLKIKFLKNGSETEKTFLSGLITFVANSFIVRNKNTSRTGTVFFIRDRERSSINYLIKIALSGMASSVGAKNNKKLLRKYSKELRQRNLPPVEYE